MSAAGPLSNLLLAFLLSLPFLTGYVDANYTRPGFGRTAAAQRFLENHEFWAAIAFLAMLQITAVFFNLLPIPPLDGFGILEPFLDKQTRYSFQRLGFSGGLLLIFFIFWYVDPVNDAFWDMIYSACSVLDLPQDAIIYGRYEFAFWLKR